MTAGRENVAIFNPLVLPLPSWHPDGPDGAIDGYVIPFVMPPGPGYGADRTARIGINVDEHGVWSALLWRLGDTAALEVVTAAQARALAAAWIRAAEVLDNVSKAAPVPVDDDVVDCEVVDDGDDNPADWPDNPDGSCRGCGVYTDNEHDANCAVYLARLRRP